MSIESILIKISTHHSMANVERQQLQQQYQTNLILDKFTLEQCLINIFELRICMHTEWSECTRDRKSKMEFDSTLAGKEKSPLSYTYTLLFIYTDTQRISHIVNTVIWAMLPTKYISDRILIWCAIFYSIAVNSENSLCFVPHSAFHAELNCGKHSNNEFRIIIVQVIKLFDSLWWIRFLLLCGQNRRDVPLMKLKSQNKICLVENVDPIYSLSWRKMKKKMEPEEWDKMKNDNSYFDSHDDDENHTSKHQLRFEMLLWNLRCL